jgi:DNA polymerase III delta prime subunit
MSTEIKYEPETIDQFVFATDELEESIAMYLQGDTNKTLVLHGPTGSGKSTLARILPSAIEGNPVTAYKMRHGDFLEHYFVERKLSEETNYKNLFEPCGQSRDYLIIDEAHKITSRDIDSYRWALDRLSKDCLMIFTTNYPDLLDDGLKSRARFVEVPTIPPERFLARAQHILRSEGLSCPDSAVIDLLEKTYAKQCDNRKYFEALDNLLFRAKMAQVRQAA